MTNPKTPGRERLTCGNWPAALKIQTRMREYRNTLEQAVLKARGVVTLREAHLIDSATSQHILSHVARRALADRHDSMTPAQLVDAFREFCAAKERRNRAVMQLRIEEPHEIPQLPPDPVDDFYSDLDADEITNGSPTIAPSEPEGPGSTSESPSAPDALEGLLGDDTNDSTNGA
jgi:hypothetical protein